MHCHIRNIRQSLRGASGLIGLALIMAFVCTSGTVLAAVDTEDTDIAVSLADLLRAARTVISANQDKINDPNLGDKGLSGDAVVEMAIANDIAATGTDPRKVDPASRKGRVLTAMIAAIKEVMAANQKVINEKGVGFKGFVPAVFARLVTEEFRTAVGDQAQIKVTAPPELIRNRKASPDQFEVEVIHTKFETAQWPNGQLFATTATTNGRQVTRVLVPEYYGAACLSCHGEPKGQIDITGYPKEGGKLGALGGVISVTVKR